MGFMKEVGKGLAQAAPFIGPVVGGIIQDRAQGKAAESQERMYGRSQDFLEDQAAKEAAWMERQYQTYMQGRQALLDKYGITVPELPGLSPGGGGAPQGAPPGAVPRGGIGALAGGAPQGAPPGGPPMGAPQAAVRRGGIGDLAGVFDWQRQVGR